MTPADQAAIDAIHAQAEKRVFYITVQSDEDPETYLARLRKRFRDMQKGGQN